MKAYTQTITKKEFVAELVAHQKADNFRKGGYWDGSKGCAVGCSLESVGRLKGIKLDKSSHALYPVHLGIPEWLARVEDTLFENISVGRSKTWPVELAKAIKTGADLEKVRVPFLVMLMEHSLVSTKSVKFDKAKYPQVVAAIEQSRAAVKQMIKAQKSGNAEKINKAADSADSAADSAAYSADSAADSAAYSARSAAYSARSAAYSAAYSARSAAYSAYSAAYSAADSAYSAYSAAKQSAYEYYANRLLEILKETK